MDLAQKNVVYLGGFGGIGQKVCAELLGRQLKALAVFDLLPNEQLLSEWQSKYPQTQTFYEKVDITKRSDLEAAYKAAAAKMSQFDVVVNGMGLMNDRMLLPTIEINLTGVIHSSLIALDYMDRTKGGQGGQIVNISSVAGLEPTAIMAIYSAAKHGVTAFTRALAHDFYFLRTGVAFVTICPGFTDTSLLHDLGDKTTFDIEAPKVYDRVKRQSAEVCAQNLVKAIELNKNAAVWLLDVGELKQLEMPVMWTPVLQD
ncbi:alcohol dehydrogenase 1 [Drosophila busckii]|uniref:alcohol dehydrogenase 1 n=1 Tax=Drosophila busckii TaxID=30019 RepID=UPI00083ECF34|nr:alcohol dehydrogenase 1 [Drosophila busckii]